MLELVGIEVPLKLNSKSVEQEDYKSVGLSLFKNVACSTPKMRSCKKFRMAVRKFQVMTENCRKISRYDRQEFHLMTESSA